MASNVLFHLNPANNGHVPSIVAVCMACAVSSPGARNVMYGTPPNEVIVGTSDPRATPSADRYRTGERIVPKNVPRQMRR
jgi:hypothetical protein